jgi:hypothetical protein
VLALPESSEHRPTERQGQQSNQLTEALRVAEVGRFEKPGAGVGALTPPLHLLAESLDGVYQAGFK